MLRWMLGNLLVWAVLFFGVPYAGVRFEENRDYETDVLCGVLFEAAIGTLK